MDAQNRPNPGRTGDAVEPPFPFVSHSRRESNNLGTDGLDLNEMGLDSRKLFEEKGKTRKPQKRN